jgi:DNA-binding beta-propeller fold protein YncE
LLNGTSSATNTPVSTLANVFILNYTAMSYQFFKIVNGTSAVGDYTISKNIYGNQFSLYAASRKLFVFNYNYTSGLWYNSTYGVTLPLGSDVFFIVYSPDGQYVYNSKGAYIVQKRNATNYALISSISTGTLEVFDIQFFNDIGD